MSPPDTRPPFPAYLLPSFNFPFRRRQSSTTSTAPLSDSPPSLSFSPSSSANTSPSSSPPTTHFLPNEIFNSALENIPPQKPPTIREGESRLHRAQPNTLKCVTCSSDIAFADQIVSKGFTGRHGRAYLVALPPPPRKTSEKDKDKDASMLPNTKIGRSVNRELLTGQHVVADVSCVICSAVLGWKYLDAKEATQKYKIGKYILEMKRVVLAVGWEDGVEEAEEEVCEAFEGAKEGEGEDDDDEVVVFDSEDEDECEDLFAGTWDPEVVAKRRGKRTWSRKKNSVEV